MSDEPTLPGTPGTPPTPPPPPPGAPTLPSSDPVEPSGDLGALAADPAADPTAVMPVTDAAAGAAAGAAAAGADLPPVDPPDAPEDPLGEPEEAVPWYKKPGPVAALVAVVVAILALLGWLIFGGSDDEDEATSTSTFLVFEASTETGDAIDVGFAVSVDGPADAAKAFEWLRPEGVPPGDIAGESTGSDGRVEFEWEPDSTIADPTTWTSTVTVVAQIPPLWTPPGPNVDCALAPLDGPQTSVTFNIVLDSDDDSIARVGTGTFPNQTFAPGDTITCRLVAGTPAPTTVAETTVPETSVAGTTVPDSVVDTTVAPTTTAAATTTAPTTTAPTPTTTEPIVTVPPVPGDSMWDVIEKNPALSDLKALIESLDDDTLLTTLQDPNSVLTLFAPSNTAIQNAAADPSAPDFSDQAVLTAILLAHASNDDPALDAAAVLAAPSVAVLEGGPQPVDATAATPTIGGAPLLVVDLRAENGIIHIIGAVMPIQP